MASVDRNLVLMPGLICDEEVWGYPHALTSVAEHQKIADLAPRGRLSIVEDCGHMPPLEHPQAATALLRDWLIYD